MHNLVVAYYSSAKPESGYSGAVRGYAQKLATALGYEALEVAALDALPEQAPEISIGLEDAPWPSVRPRCELKARPYADQHGQGPSMHTLTDAMLAQASWELPTPVGLLCVANPHWLVTDVNAWGKRIEVWAQCNEVKSIIISNSPRTNPLMWEPFTAALKQILTIPVIVNECGKKNRYINALAAADAICILGSSRSMAGEAAMSRTPIAYVADDAASEAGFFADVPQALKARYHRFGENEALPRGSFEPFDVTQRYIDEALTQIRSAKAA